MNTSQPQAPRTAADIEAELLSLPSERDLELQELDPPAPTPPQDESEATARRKGWLPKSEFSGDPSKWVDAKTFIERGDNFNKNLQREVAALKQKLADFEGTKTAFKKFHEETLAKKDKELQAAINALRVQRSQATQDGDHEAAIALEDRIDELKSERAAFKKVEVEQQAPAATAANPAGIHAEVMNEWIEDGNSWFREDAKLQAYAVAVGEDLIKSGEQLRGRKFLDKVASIVAEDFPRKFRQRQAATPTASPVEASSAPSRAVPGKRYSEADLPAEDLRLMKQFIKEGWTTKEKFLAGYFSR